MDVPRTKKTSLPHRCLQIIVFATLTGALTSCANVTPFHRTLPDWVERVYVPMVDNQTFEPGLEELVTNAFITEIMADGRLEVVKKAQSDVLIRITLTNYREQTDDFESDDIERNRLIEITAKMELFFPGDTEHAIASMEDIITTNIFRSDYRSIYVTLDVDALQQLAQRTGGNLLRTLMSRIEFEEI